MSYSSNTTPRSRRVGMTDSMSETVQLTAVFCAVPACWLGVTRNRVPSDTWYHRPPGSSLLGISPRVSRYQAFALARSEAGNTAVMGNRSNILLHLLDGAGRQAVGVLWSTQAD